MNLVRTFTINLHGQPCRVEAAISRTAYLIMAVTDRVGRNVDTSCCDLDAIEAEIDSRIKADAVYALSPTTGREERYSVHHIGNDVISVVNAGGYALPSSSPEFTEVAEAWHIDREYEQAVESDAPRAAALAGYIHPRPIPNQQGHGYRRAA